MRLTLLSVGWIGLAVLGVLLAVYHHIDAAKWPPTLKRFVAFALVSLFLGVLAIELSVLYLAARLIPLF